MDSFVDRLNLAMSRRNMTQADLVKATGISKPRISQYVNGIYEAKQDALLKLSLALCVDVAWLMGYDVPEDSSVLPILSPAAMQLVESFNKLNEEGQEMVLNYAEVLDLSGRYKKHNSDGMGIKEA